MFLSPESTFCADSYFGIRSTSVLPQQHVKDPSHSAKSAGVQVTAKHACTIHTCGFASNDMVHGCTVYTERAETAFSCGTRHASAVDSSVVIVNISLNMKIAQA